MTAVAQRRAPARKPPAETFQCGVCASDDLHDLTEFARLPRVTSDCKPWPAGGCLSVCRRCGTIQKKADAKWLKEIDSIYGAYAIYQLSGGEEQVIFTEAGPQARSKVLVDFVVDALGGPRPEGALIDIGCGTGSALTNFSAALPGWAFDGSELSEQNLPVLRKIPGFRTLHTGEIDGEYDVVTMIHSLEHMVTPQDTLSEAARLLRSGGILFVEVPDAETSPFDLVIADHRTHFTSATLGALAHRAGLAADFVGNSVLPKENTLLAHRNGAVSAALPPPGDGMALAANTLAWLDDVLGSARDAASGAATFGIFGTSISGMWLYGALRDRVAFFVDEDKSRTGRSYEGRPILAPQDAPAGSVVFIPMANAIADRIAARLEGGNASFVTPPPFPGGNGVGLKARMS